MSHLECINYNVKCIHYLYLEKESAKVCHSSLCSDAYDTIVVFKLLPEEKLLLLMYYHDMCACIHMCIHVHIQARIHNFAMYVVHMYRCGIMLRSLPIHDDTKLTCASL